MAEIQDLSRWVLDLMALTVVVSLLAVQYAIRTRRALRKAEQSWARAAEGWEAASRRWLEAAEAWSKVSDELRKRRSEEQR